MRRGKRTYFNVAQSCQFHIIKFILSYARCGAEQTAFRYTVHMCEGAMVLYSIVLLQNCKIWVLVGEELTSSSAINHHDSADMKGTCCSIYSENVTYALNKSKIVQ